MGAPQDHAGSNHAHGQALLQDITALPRLDETVQPQSPQMPMQCLSPAVHSPPDLPSHPRQDPRRWRWTLRHKPRVQEMCLLFKLVHIAVRSLRHACVPSSVQDPEKTPHSQTGSPLRALFGSVPGLARQGWCAKRKLGVCTCSEAPPRQQSALHLPFGPSRSAESELALPHRQ